MVTALPALFAVMAELRVKEAVQVLAAFLTCFNVPNIPTAACLVMKTKHMNFVTGQLFISTLGTWVFLWSHFSYLCRPWWSFSPAITVTLCRSGSCSTKRQDFESKAQLRSALPMTIHQLMMKFRKDSNSHRGSMKRLKRRFQASLLRQELRDSESEAPIILISCILFESTTEGR